MSLDVAALVVSSTSLAVGLIVLTLTGLNYRRDRERADIDWQVEPAPDAGRGTFEARNTGRDLAHEVLVEMWDSHDYVTAEAKTAGRDDLVRVVLPHREQHGADEVPMPPKIKPPPSVGQVDELRRQFERADALMDARFRSQQEAEQVMWRIVWRTRRGTWRSEDGSTG